MSAQRYRQLAIRQTKIAQSIPLPALRQRFLTSAERYETLAQAEEELASSAPSEGPLATD
jgi:hypothetical protein